MAAHAEENMVGEQTQPRVCISILNWKNTQDTLRCIQSLQDIDPKTNFIVVLDNESTSESLQMLEGLQHVKVLASTENLGFAGGHNRVMQWARDRGFDYIWLLNNDAIVQPQCLERLLAYAQQHKECALISPSIFDCEAPHAPQHIVSILNETKTGAYEYTDLKQAAVMQAQHPEKVVLWGTALLVRTAAIDNIGYFDEGLFAYAEDTDYALRAIAHGWRNAVVMDAHIWHEHPKPPRKPHFYYYKHRNSIAIARKHAGLKNTLKLMYWNLRLARKELTMLKASPETVDALYSGIWHGWTGKTGRFRAEVSAGWLARRLVQMALRFS